jgi:hypothetical protein
MIGGCPRFQRVGFTFFVLLILSFSFPPAPINASFLDDLARDTWNYLGSDWARSQHLPWSWRSTDPNLLGGEYCNPAEIGLLTLSYLAAFDLNRSWGPEWSTAEEEVMAILNQLIAWQTGTQSTQPHGPNSYHNLFFQWYWINETQWSPPVVGDANGDNQVVPSVDNAWLAACLVTIKEYAVFHNGCGSI